MKFIGKIMKKKRGRKKIPKKKNIVKSKAKLKNKDKENQKSLVTSKNFKTKEEKVAIEKIKKQPNEKRVYNIKDYIVYPKHGVGKIVAVSKAMMGGIEINFYKVFIEKDKLTLSIPINQQFHLRPVATINQINKSLSILKSKPKIKRTMWSRRAQEYDQKINSGKIYELAEVVRDLNKNTHIEAEQSYSERQLFEKAYERLKAEFEVVLSSLSKENVQKKMDKALKRDVDYEQVV